MAITCKNRLTEPAFYWICCFSGGSEYDSTRNNEPPAMPVSLSCFSFKQKTSYATMNVVPQPHYVTRR